MVKKQREVFGEYHRGLVVLIEWYQRLYANLVGIIYPRQHGKITISKAKLLSLSLSILIGIYLYLLLSPSQPHMHDIDRNFVIKRDSFERFQAFINSSTHPSWEGGGVGGGGDGGKLSVYRRFTIDAKKLDSQQEWQGEGKR